MREIILIGVWLVFVYFVFLGVLYSREGHGKIDKETKNAYVFWMSYFALILGWSGFLWYARNFRGLI